MGRQVVRRAAVLALVALVAVACGSSRGNDQGGATAPTATSGQQRFGTLASPCGGRTSGPNTASDTGVTADAIQIGFGDDAGFPQAAGLGREMSDAVKALIKWCNDQGGINGRMITGKYYDARLLEVNNRWTEACADKIFMMVGEGYALDASQEQVRLGCKLPAFPAYGVSPQFTNGPLVYYALPNPVDYQSVSEARYYAEKFPQKARKVATIYANFSASMDTKDKQNSTWPKVGITHMMNCQISFNIQGEPDYKPFAQKLKDCGAEAVSFVGAPYPAFENFLEAANQLDYNPDYLLQGNFYDPQLAKWNTAGLADNIYVRVQDIPFEYADTNKATKQYVGLVNANGGRSSLLGVHAASAFLLWATQVKACGANLTRQCVLDRAAKVHAWDGGGLSGKADVGNNKPSDCEAVMRLRGTKWVQVYPEKVGTLGCDPDNVQQATGEVVDKVRLGPDRKTHDFEQ